MSTFKISIARPVVRASQSRTRTVEAQICKPEDLHKGWDSVPAHSTRYNLPTYQLRFKSILSSCRSGRVSLMTISRIVVIANICLPLLSWLEHGIGHSRLTDISRRVKSQFVLLTLLAVLYTSSFIVLAKLALVVSILTLLYRQNPGRLMEAIMASQSQLFNALLHQYVDSLMVSLEKQVQTSNDENGRVAHKCADKPPAHKAALTRNIKTRADTTAQQKSAIALSKRAEGLYVEFDQEGWLLVPSARLNSNATDM